MMRRPPRSTQSRSSAASDVYKRQEGISIKEAMLRLPARERLILKLRFFEGRTQMEVADEIGISQAQVSRLEKAALRQMRGSM